MDFAMNKTTKFLKIPREIIILEENKCDISFNNRRNNNWIQWQSLKTCDFSLCFCSIVSIQPFIIIVVVAVVFVPVVVESCK